MFNTLGNSIPRNGLVGEWLLDGGTLDTSGNGNNGTPTNILFVKTDKGYQSQAGSFNGSSSFITSGFPTQVANVAIYTSLWIKRAGTGSSGNNCIIQFGNTQNNIRFGLWINASNQLGIWNSGGGATYSAIVPTLNTWEHYIFGRDGTNVYIYKNSQLVYSAANSSNDGASVIAAMRMGQRESNSGEFYNGQLQGVRVYNRILSQDEIQSLYLEGLRKLGPTNIAKYPSLLSGLVGYWDFRGSAHNLVDGSLATVTGATLTQDRFGNPNSAYSFSGGTNMITVPTNIFLNTSNTNRTYHFILKGTLTTTLSSIYTEYSNSGAVGIFIGNNRIYVGNNTDVSSDTVYNTTNNNSTYYYVTITFSGNTVKIYRDGVLGATNTGWIWRTKPDNVAAFGRYATTGADQLSLSGVIDMGCMINKTLSEDEVKLLYDLTSKDYIYPTPSYDIASLRDGLVLDLNEQGYDLSGNGNNGTLVNSPAVVRQGRAKGLSYNGSNQYTTFGTGLYDNIKTINNYAFSFWIKLNSLTGGGVIYSTQTNVNFYLYFDANGRSRLRREANFSDGANGDFYTGKWAHYVVNYTGATTADLYRDGIKIVSNYNISPTTNSSLGFVYGAYYDNSLKINGQIISPKIWNRALSDKEIQALYYSQKGSFIY